MRSKQFLIIFLFLFLVCGLVSAQSATKKSTAIKLNLGVSTPFGFPSGSSSIIPDIGVDFNFGDFGIRAAGSFFKTNPEFDFDAYLAPISSFITQTGEAKHSNLTLGISPYFNLPMEGVTLQPSLGINYLSQTGADLMATYGNLAPGAILNATGGDNKRSAVMLSPSLRAVLGDANKPLRFFAQASYNMAVGIKEFKITRRNLDGVLLPNGGIDPDLMEMGTTISSVEKLIPPSFYIGIGLELNIMESRPRNSARNAKASNPYIGIGIELNATSNGPRGSTVTSSVAFSDYIMDNYDPNSGIPDAFITGEQNLTPVAKNGGKYETTLEYFIMSPGEPVPGAEVYLEQEPDEEPIANMGTTGKKGTLEFHEKQQLVSKVDGKDVSYKMQINIPKNYYVAKLKESNVGMLEFDYTIETDQGDIVYKILVGGDNTENPNINVWEIRQSASGGPYSQSVSNMEDDGIISVKVPLYDLYEAKLINGTLTCSSIRMEPKKDPTHE